ncbi:tRNA dihydrouridine synthase B [Aquipluma nitroreducens]|uniref:tRNA-dihydrouridine synthase n=1 Tax=Aquipluma nitroreducens TaxID=2010828 RepID=A0A5K7SGJ4_9BACT|nr:tRNA-dihydrouridine synthase [Aquipluma nitroreducens]BBE20721.1 tRNA dihydrouridine synthase B [Aquipluma nitroreducens]
MSNFWDEIQKPIFALAPMEDVTDTSFREIVARLADPKYLSILYTEFTSVDGMNHPVGKLRVGERLIVSESERQVLNQKNIKLIAQIWGKKPELFHKIAAEITSEYNFDGLDINMGCPVKNVVKNGCCSALINEPNLAKEIVLATKEATHLPVSVKTRTGIRTHDTESWIANLLETKPAAIILHGRTQKQQSDGLADWDEIAKGARMRDQINPETKFLGNGDVMSVAQGEDLCQKYQLDGIMVGRGIFHNPWFFNPSYTSPLKTEKLQQLLLHTQLFEKSWGNQKNINILNRFYKIYTNDFPGAAKLRADLMEAKTFEEVYRIVHREIV